MGRVLHPLDHSNSMYNLPNNSMLLKIRDNNILDICKKVYPVETSISFEIPFDFSDPNNDIKCFAIEGKNIGKIIRIDEIKDDCFDRYISIDNSGKTGFVVVHIKAKNYKVSYNINDLFLPSGIIIISG